MPAITISENSILCFDEIRNRVANNGPNEGLCGWCSKYVFDFTPACWNVRYEFWRSCPCNRTYNRYMASVISSSRLLRLFFSYPE